MRAARALGVIICACVAGVVGGEGLSRAACTRSIVGRILGRGEFIGIVRGTAYFAGDLDDPSVSTALRAEELRGTNSEAAKAEDIEREVTLLQEQFGDAAAFRAAVAESGTDEATLRMSIADHLAVRGWAEQQVADQLAVSDDECRRVYGNNPAAFLQPKRYRARHLFIAAPDGTPDDVVAEKRSAAEGLAVRLLAGEAFDKLAAEASEDEATKLRGGDLGYFAAPRMPAEFIVELEKLAVGQRSPPFRSHLGFHVVELTDEKPENALTFEQAAREVARKIANDKRAAAVAQLVSARPNSIQSSALHR